MKTIRCAIYTRKSSDEGLEQPFNSLDAQREACAAYVLSQASEGWVALPDIYDDGGLTKAMKWPSLTVGVGVVGVVIAALAFTTLGQVFLPQLDEGDVLVQALRIPGTSVDQSQAMQFQIEKAIAKQPEVKFVFSKTGTSEVASDPMPANATDTFIILKPRDQWPNPSLTKEELVSTMEKRLSTLPGNVYEITQPIQMRFNELIAGVRGDIAVNVFGDDFAAMNATADKIAGILRQTKGAADVKVEQTEGLPMLDIKVNRDAMARLGVTAQDVQDTISTAVGGREAGTIYEGDRRFPVVIRLADTDRADFATLGQVPVPVPGGRFVPLASVATISVEDGPNQISRENGKRRVVVQANVRGRDVSGVVADARAAIARDVRLPAGSYLEWGGQFENLASARDRLALVVPACFALILFLLYGALGSARDAAIVFTGVPLALVGGVLALVLRGMPFSISAAVGFIALSGIAVLNGLVMVSSIQDLMARGMDRATAAHEGAMQRLRPVVMTALVASLGFVPMALGHGAGAEVQKPLATVVIGGLISATLLTLFVLPTLYARFGRRELPVSRTEHTEDMLPAPDTGSLKGMTMHDHTAGGHAHDHAEGGGHDHGHGGRGHSHAPKSFGEAFAIGTALNLGFVIIEAGYGIAAGSMALLADAGHNLSDVLGLLIAWGAATLGRRSPKGRYTYGFRSSSILAAFLNALLLLVAIVIIAVEAIRRFSEPASVAGGTVMIVAAIGIAVNTATALLFMSGRKGDLNIKGAFLHMAADAAVSAGVVVAGFIIVKTGLSWIDPVTSLVIVAVIAIGTWGLLRDSVNMSLQAAPPGLDPEEVAGFLRGQHGVQEIHDLHVWPMSTTETALTVHLLVPGGYPGDAYTARVAADLKEKFGIDHATIQIETDPATPCELESDKTV